MGGFVGVKGGSKLCEGGREDVEFVFELELEEAGGPIEDVVTPFRLDFVVFGVGGGT